MDIPKFLVFMCVCEQRQVLYVFPFGQAPQWCLCCDYQHTHLDGLRKKSYKGPNGLFKHFWRLIKRRFRSCSHQWVPSAIYYVSNEFVIYFCFSLSVCWKLSLSFLGSSSVLQVMCNIAKYCPIHKPLPFLSTKLHIIIPWGHEVCGWNQLLVSCKNFLQHDNKPFVI